MGAKRVIDIAGALAGLVLTAPFWLYWALRIKLSSPGSVFFVHDRVGKDGEIFRMIKFRTMEARTDPYCEAPEERTDPRIARYGRWLRRSSIDEIPQLLNVLLGNMSLVGPRPRDLRRASPSRGPAGRGRASRALAGPVR